MTPSILLPVSSLLRLLAEGSGDQILTFGLLAPPPMGSGVIISVGLRSGGFIMDDKASLEPTGDMLIFRGGGAISDASFPTTLVQHWSRDRSRGRKLPLEQVIKMQTSETANLLGINDRGVIEEGYKADINVIDYDGLTLHEPEIINDLPAGGRRLVQKASGYDYTIVSGEIAFIKGEATGALNGRLIRNSH